MFVLIHEFCHSIDISCLWLSKVDVFFPFCRFSRNKYLVFAKSFSLFCVFLFLIEMKSIRSCADLIGSNSDDEDVSALSMISIHFFIWNISAVNIRQMLMRFRYFWEFSFGGHRAFTISLFLFFYFFVFNRDEINSIMPEFVEIHRRRARNSGAFDDLPRFFN